MVKNSENVVQKRWHAGFQVVCGREGEPPGTITALFFPAGIYALIITNIPAKMHPPLRRRIQSFPQSLFRYTMQIPPRSKKIPATIFNNVYIYDKNMNQVTSFTETSVNWTETFTVSNPSDTFFIKMETNSPPSWYDFDACLTRECNNNIDLPGQSICEGDPLCFDVVNCNGGDYLSIAIGGTIVATQPTPIFGNMTVTYCFPSLGFTTGSITVEACLYESSTGIAGYCETFTVTILPPPAIQITEGNVTICLGEFCFHDLTQNAYEVDWDLYYYYPGVGLNDEDHYHNRPPNDLYCYTFVNTGDYVLTATATGQCGTEESTVNIHVVPAVAEFDWTNACVGQPVCFTELASCEEFWHWDFGDGSTSTDPNPCH
ncbi:MAG: hypothetical protein CVV34_05930, partial [Methanomicrobiales archaeon HGW-Methanomicrobiales-5]